jgi:hypothetical protein
MLVERRRRFHDFPVRRPSTWHACALGHRFTGWGRSRPGPARRHTPVVEDLGTTTIQGYEVQGKRMTTTIPAGEVGNSEPIVIVNEHWSSSQFPFALRDINDDPRSGKRTRELVSLTPGEPDLSIFQPPQGYDVSEEELHQITCRQASQ